MSPPLAKVLQKIREADLPAFAHVELASPNVRGVGFGETPLHVVAVWGDMDSAKVLITEGATLDIPGEHGCTPLHEAALQGHVEFVRLLLAHGADPKRKCEFGDLLEIAGRSDNPEMRRVAQA